MFFLSYPHLLQILRDGFHQAVGLCLQFQQFLVDLLHPLGKIHTIILHGCNAHIGTGRQGCAFLVEDGVAASHLAQTGNVLINALAKLFGEPDGLLGNGQLLAEGFQFLVELFLRSFALFAGCCLHSGFGFFPLGLHVCSSAA